MTPGKEICRMHIISEKYIPVIFFVCLGSFLRCTEKKVH